MKQYKGSFSVIALALAMTLAGCSSAPTKPQAASVPQPTVTRAEAVVQAPVTPVSQIPSWYLANPEATDEAVFVGGTAVSRDMAMSEHKAVLDAETRLAHKLGGSINTLTKDYKRDVGDEFAQSTEIVTNKSATNTKLIGEVVVNRQITAENGSFRTYVLIKFPVGNANRILQNYENKKTFTGSRGSAEQELATQVEADKVAAPEPVVVTVPKVVPVEIPKDKVTNYDGIVAKPLNN